MATCICAYNIVFIGLLFINVLAANFEGERARTCRKSQLRPRFEVQFEGFG